METNNELLQKPGSKHAISDMKMLWRSSPLGHFSAAWKYMIILKSRTSNLLHKRTILQQSARKLLSPLCNTEHWRHFLSFFRIVPLGRALCMGWATGEVAAAVLRRQWTVNLDPPGSITLKRIEASKNCRCFAQNIYNFTCGVLRV